MLLCLRMLVSLTAWTGWLSAPRKGGAAAAHRTEGCQWEDGAIMYSAIGCLWGEGLTHWRPSFLSHFLPPPLLQLASLPRPPSGASRARALGVCPAVGQTLSQESNFGGQTRRSAISSGFDAPAGNRRRDVAASALLTRLTCIIDYGLDRIR